MRSKVIVGIATLALVSALFPATAAAGTASLSIDAVGGRKIANGQVKGTLSGKVVVQGTAVPGGATSSAPAPKPLVADAGDSAFVGSDATATLIGAAFGGTEPYTFSWTTSAGTLEGASSATAQLKTAGVAPGTYAATLGVTDSAGATATDTVKVVVFQTAALALLDQTKADGTPGVLGAGVPGTIDFPFTVPVGTTKFDVLVSWTNSLNDYDIRVLRPDGSEETNHGDGAGVPEQVSVTNPVAGSWTLAVDKFATVTDSVRARITGLGAPADPRPVVRSGGPYKFATGATQAVAGSVSGGTAPVSVGWDTDFDGRLDKSGASFTGSFAEGRRLITIKATDANGLERRETTSLLVATPARLAAITTAITVIGVNDSGINPYHLEFSALTYPDPDVLALTANFTKHPSEYIPGYPKDAAAIHMTLGQGYLPPADAHLWEKKDTTHPNGLEYGKLYWIPGTKIVGAIQNADLACSNCADGAHVILDDDGHGTESSSVSTGNRVGYCPTCLIVLTKGLDVSFSSPTSWIDISSNSWGTVANVPLDLVTGSIADTTRAAVERGQTILFAAGNGNGNAFESPSPTYGTSKTGPDWNVVVGAIRRDNQRAIIGDGMPAHVSSWGDGNLPSACRTGTVSQCAFGGTSAATPYTAGIFGTVLTNIRRNIGDGAVGQRPGQVVADGFPIPNSAYLADGKLTRGELREAVLKTAFPLNQDNTQSIPIFPFPWTAPYVGDVNVLFEGYGAATPNSAKRAVDVLMGKTALPVRDAEDRWFAIDRQIRDSIWGGYDRDGDGTRESAAPVGAFGVTAASFANADLTALAIKKIADQINTSQFSGTTATSASALTYYLHRTSEGDPGATPSCDDPVTFMDQNDSAGDWDGCFENRATTVLAAYRPVGIWPTATDSTVVLPAGTTVDVELYLATDQVTVIRPSAVLMASDRVLGTGAGTPAPTIGSGPWIAQGLPVNPNVVNGAPPIPTGVAIDQNKCKELGELCWNKFTWSFPTTRPAITGELLTFQVSLIGARAWSFGYEGQHRSKIAITPGTDTAGLDFGVTMTDPAEGAKVQDAAFTAYGSASFPNLGTTEAGDHPTLKRVDVSVDDATFANPVKASLDEGSGAWSAPLPKLSPGAHKLYARAAIDRNYSPVLTRNITVLDTQTSPRVEWQVTPAGTAPSANGWQAAGGLLSYAFSIDTKAYGKGDFTISVRLLEGGATTASTAVLARFSGR